MPPPYQKEGPMRVLQTQNEMPLARLILVVVFFGYIKRKLWYFVVKFNNFLDIYNFFVKFNNFLRICICCKNLTISSVYFYRWKWNACGHMQMRSWWTSWLQLIAKQRICEQLLKHERVNKLPRLPVVLNTYEGLAKCPQAFLPGFANEIKTTGLPSAPDL